MTDTRKSVSRRTVEPVHAGRRIIVTIGPGDVLGFREERTRKTFLTSIRACYELAVRQSVACAGKGKP